MTKLSKKIEKEVINFVSNLLKPVKDCEYIELWIKETERDVLEFMRCEFGNFELIKKRVFNIFLNYVTDQKMNKNTYKVIGYNKKYQNEFIGFHFETENF